MTKKRKRRGTHAEELRKARSAARNARERLKSFKEGMKEGMNLSREARRD